MIPKYDRLNGIDTEEETFNFVCPKCGSDGIKNKDLFRLDVIGVVTKPDDVDNSDLPKEVRNQYDKLPTTREALLNHTQDTDKERVLVQCKNCGPITTGHMKFNKTKLRKWVNKNYPEVLKL